MKTYELILSFIEGVYVYLFTETNMVNGEGKILFRGIAKKKIRGTASVKNMYVLYYTENTILKFDTKNN